CYNCTRLLGFPVDIFFHITSTKENRKMKETQPINNMVVEIVNRKNPGIENLAITLKVGDLTKVKTDRGESRIGYGM
ncbi:MAG: hypothetical protein NUV42_02065, partial [Candidatus Yonathbacteria bacterium]|nr:hypothetical protein [Candidatus Yonathbacteria bacterium]